MHRLLIAGIVALLACGGDVESTADSAPPADTPASAPAGQPTAAVSDASILDVTLAEWSVQLSRDSVPAGLVSLRVRNAGTMPHRLEVEGNGEEVETDDLAAGTEITMTMNLPAGTYELYCPIDAAGIDHDARGMRTRLRVY
jgi:hypothetical protein